MAIGSDVHEAGAVSHWSRHERYVFGVVACSVWILTCSYSLFLDRELNFDEAGLFNAVYTFLETGRIAYPLHGQPDFMTIHPPTHYVLIAVLMKSGLRLFAAAAVPLLMLTTLVLITIATGAFRFPVALALLLGFFCGTTISAEYAHVRPDLHLTLAWFSGLVMLEAARNHEWSPWRLAVGSALSAYAATLHYWGIAALAVPFVYACSLLLDRYRDLRFVRQRLASIAIGGLVVGLPFLVGFVVPRWQSIMGIIGSVQSDGGVATAIGRHLSAYSYLASTAPQNWQPRFVVTLLTYPLLKSQIPAVVVAVLTFAACCRFTFAAAACVLPIFVLVYSQGKSFPYFTPELTLYFTGLFMCVFVGAAWVLRRAAQPVGGLAVVASGILVVGSLIQVPNVVGSQRVWTWSPQDFELGRALAFDLVGPDALIGMVSLGPWYASGGEYVWIAANELTVANRSGADVDRYLRATDAFVIDRDWWHALPDLAPLGSWYLDRKLSLLGFVLPTSQNRQRDFTLFATRHAPTRVRGYFQTSSGAQLFEQVADGDAAFSVWQCPRPVLARNLFPAAFYRFEFHYNATPGADSPVILMLGNEWEREDALERQANALSCRSRDIIRGRVSKIDPTALLAKLRRSAQPIKVGTTFSDAVAPRVLAHDGDHRAGPRRTSLNIAWDKAGIDAAPASAGRRQLPLIIHPPVTPWAYGGVLPIRVEDRQSAGLLVRVRARILEGSAGIGIVTKDEKDFVARSFRDASDEPATFNLIVPAGVEHGPLVVQNGQYGGETNVELQSIDAFLIHDPEEASR